MRNYLVTAAIIAYALPATARFAEEVHQPSADHLTPCD
jgi:hypothetical protein